MTIHRGLNLDGAIGQGEICKFEIRDYVKIKILNVKKMMHFRSMGHQSYALLCSKITSFQPSEGQFSEKPRIFSKVKIFQRTSWHILEKIKKNKRKKK